MSSLLSAPVKLIVLYVFQGLHGMPGPKVRLIDPASSVVRGGRFDMLFGAQCCCLSNAG